MTVELPSAAARFRTRIDSLKADRHELQRSLEDVAAAGDDGDRIVDEIAEVDRDIARAQIKLEAADRAEQAQRDQAAAQVTAARRKTAEKLLATYERQMLRVEQLIEETGAVYAQANEAFMAFHAHTGGETSVVGSVTKPRALMDQLVERLRQAIVGVNIKNDSGRPMGVSRRFESIASLFATKRATALPWIARR